jgi:hypothetical protein
VGEAEVAERGLHAPSTFAKAPHPGIRSFRGGGQRNNILRRKYQKPMTQHHAVFKLSHAQVSVLIAVNAACSQNKRTQYSVQLCSSKSSVEKLLNL